MATLPQTEIELAPVESDVPRWNLAKRIVFRFCFLYFVLFCVSTQVWPGLFPIPKMRIPDLVQSVAVRNAVIWTAVHVFHVTTTVIYTGSGSGDKTFDWVLAFCGLVVAAAGTVVWSVIDRRRPAYPGLYKWFTVFVRFALGSQMVLYGLAKAVPLQMPFPQLTRLVEPYGNFSPMGVLWYSIGASPSYEIFVGLAELFGGILVMIPWTATFGALVCLADVTEVFMLNMTYDVPVKLFSFHLILMSLWLLAPELGRMARFFFANRAVEPSTQVKLFSSRLAMRIAVVVQVIWALAIVGVHAQGSWQGWHSFGGGSPKSPLYGIWNIERMTKDGQAQPAVVTDAAGWRRVIFDRPTGVSFQKMDDTFVGYGATMNGDGGFSLTRGNDKNWKANFQSKREGEERMTLTGEMDGHRYEMQLQLLDRSKMMLISRGFHWIQEYPLNR